MAAGGNSPNPTANTEEWNGSAWTEVSGNLNTARKSLAAAGTRESAVVFGGFGPPYYANTEVWNGTSFSENADLNNARNQLGGAGSSSTSALAFEEIILLYLLTRHLLQSLGMEHHGLQQEI